MRGGLAAIWAVAICAVGAAGCAGMGGDPRALIAAGQAALQATQDAGYLEQQAAYLEQARVDSQARQTEAAFALELTATSAAAYAQQTSQAGEATVTERARAATTTARGEAALATQTSQALEAAANDARRREARLEFLNWLYYGLALTAALGMAMGLWRGIPTLFAWGLEWADRRRAIYETRAGTVAWMEVDGAARPVLLSEASYYRPRRQAEEGGSEFPAALRIGAGVMESRPARGGHSRLHWRALELLKMADPEEDQIPGWRRAGWSSGEWQEVVEAMIAAGAAQTNPGVGTFVADGYEDVRSLMYALEVGTVSIRRPTLAGDGGEGG